MRVLLTVMSGLDPHMISVIRMRGLDVGMVDQSILLGQTATVVRNQVASSFVSL
jgi:hypothetical protein